MSSINLPNRKGRIDERFQPIFDKLLEIRNQLERLSLTQAWSLRETDLYGYQRQLDRIDEARVDGNFEDAQGNKAELHAQRVRSTTTGQSKLTNELDPALAPAPQLRLYLPAVGIVGARVRSPHPRLQSAADASAMSDGGQEIRRRLLLARALSL
jgi:hypothetical protein